MGYEISWESKGVTKRLFGRVTDNDLIKATSIIQADPRIDDLDFVIIDFLDCVSHSVSDPALIEIAALEKAAAENSMRYARAKTRVAIIAMDRKIIGLAMQYANFEMNTMTFGIFSNRSDARAWLGVE